MFDKFFKGLFGDPTTKVVKRYQPTVDVINSLEKRFEAMSDEELRGLTAEFRERIRSAAGSLNTQLQAAEEEHISVLGTDEQKFARVEVDRIKKDILAAEEDALEDILAEAFAAVREASKRTIGLRHYDVQLIGGMVLHSGTIAEMKTGEGKTLVATLPLYLNALAGRGVHLITPNDYLSKVGLQLMGPVYQKLGMTAAVIQNSAGNPDKGSFIYDPDFPSADDRFLGLRPVTRREAYNADITYGTNNEFGFDYLRDNMVQSVNQLSQRELHYAIVDEVDNILVDEARTPLIISGEARESSNYYVEFAALVRTLREDTHYVVNEKERVATLTEDGITFIEQRLNLENLYDFSHAEMIPYLDNALRAHALFKKDHDYIVRNTEVIIVDEFTGRLMEGRRYSEGLHQAIEAKEGVKVQKESMTLATITFQNFFRMYDKLAGMTGTAKTEEEEFQRIYNLDVALVPTYRPIVRQDLADYVYRTPENKFKAVIDDIVEANKRKQPVLVGTVAIETSELVSTLLKRRGVDHEVLNAKNHEREATIIAQAGRPGSVTIATNMAGRGVDILLGGNFEGLAREHLRKEDIELSDISQTSWNHALDLLKHGKDITAAYPERWAEVLSQKFKETEKDKELVRSLGGLYVIGTERHEARRIDNQLRGRSGRLGDPGQSRFYLSLGDDLMRRFGGERISSIMTRLGVEDDMPIEAGVVSKAIENAQTKVEGHNFDVRKHVLQYDEVVNEQRNRIYDQRRRILNEPSMKLSIETMIDEEISALANGFTSGDEADWELENLAQALGGLFHMPSTFSVEQWEGLKREEIEDQAVEFALNSYEGKEKLLGEVTMRRFEKQILLWAVDNRWIRHLTDLDRLREGIGLQAFAQVDPLVAYKREAFAMYGELMNDIREDVVKAVLTLQLQPKQVQGQNGPAQTQTQSGLIQAPGQSQGQPQEQAQGESQGQSASQNNGDAFADQLTPTPIARNIRTNRDAPAAQTVRKSGPDVGRNDPCWCGSGKKYKSCHMNSDRSNGGASGGTSGGAQAGDKKVAAGR